MHFIIILVNKVIHIASICSFCIFRKALASLLTEVRIVMVKYDSIDSVQVEEKGNRWMVDRAHILYTPGTHWRSQFSQSRALVL